MFLRLIILLISILFTKLNFAQIKLTRLDKSTVPSSVKYPGNIVHAVSWIDKTGNNLLILSETGKIQSKNNPGENSDAALYAYHFITAGDSVRESWKVYDHVKECPVDLFLYFVDKTFQVTDLDKDGKAEAWIMYKVSCQGDVSPVTMKIIMYEENKKHAARGTTRVKVSEKDYLGGEVTFDEAFKSSPQVFKKFAQELWKEHKEETWGQ